MNATAITRAYVDGRFGQMHLRRAGESREGGPPPLVMFHGNPLSGRVFEPLMAALGESRMCVAIDTPGFGQSDPPPSPPPMEDYAAAMGDAVDALGLGAVDVLGWHTGSRIAVATAEQRAAQVRRVILIGAPVYSPERIAAAAHYQGVVVQDDGGHLVKEWSSWYWPKDAPANQFNDLFADAMLSVGLPHRNWMVPANMAYAYPDHLPRLAQPVWVFNPEGMLHDDTVKVAPYIREGGVIALPDNMYRLVTVHAAQLAAMINERLA